MNLRAIERFAYLKHIAIPAIGWVLTGENSGTADGRDDGESKSNQLEHSDDFEREREKSVGLKGAKRLKERSVERRERESLEEREV